MSEARVVKAAVIAAIFATACVLASASSEAAPNNGRVVNRDSG